MTTSPLLERKALGMNGTHSDSDVRRANGAEERIKGHAALDLAETAEVSTKHAEGRLEAKRFEHEKARTAHRAKFEEQMRQLEADQLAEETQYSHPSSGTPPSNKTNTTNSSGNGTTSAPSTPPGASSEIIEKPAVAGQGGQGRDAGAKSMPTSRRASGYGGGSFGLEKLSLSVMEPGNGNGNGTRSWLEPDEDDVDAEGAQSSVKYLGMGDDDPFPSMAKKDNNRLSAASAALDLAPLSQAPPRAFGQRPFETSLKTSEWPQFAPPQSTTAPNRGLTSPLPQPAHPELNNLLGGIRKTSTSPTGMADSIASLPAMPSKSVPGTPFGLGHNTGSVPNVGGVAGLNGPRRSGTGDNIGGDGLNAAHRGFSNPDLARAFGKAGGGFSVHEPRPYGVDPGYGMFSPITGPLPASAVVAAAFTPQPPVYDHYGFDEDGYGSGALYPGGPMGLKNKRADAEREFNRFTGVRIEDLQGELLNLCKDQHGCRYLQKQLEDGDPAHRDLIFRETYGHFPELMTDPFGNYLCQKLLEYSTEEQRSAIIESVAGDLVGISLNMHGTRAVQKMVDFLASPRQVKMIRILIYALSVNVVALIKDLNGNHVIQKCLNKLVPEDNQFIYNAIAANLIEVATHRHGCCVLQRSIDHASPAQRVQLVTEIIFNSLYLVQDPFGNYVIQYILDLNDARFSEPLIRTFIGNICSLSVQKFSSNVVEKCIRVADPEIRKALVAEVLNRSRLEKLLRDSYGNYVIQTILDYCDANQRLLLVECIRPILPSIRNTPYGKRIQSKLAREDASFNNFGPPGPGGGYPRGGVQGGFRGGPPGPGGPGGYQRHLGRPQLQHINALTEVYGSQGPFLAHPQHHQQQHHNQHQHQHPGQQQQPHQGMAYHAPGPDGQPWLHLRAGGGGPAPNWGMGSEAGGDVTPPNGFAGGMGGMEMGMWDGQGQGQGQAGGGGAVGFMPYTGAPHPHAMM